MNTNEKSKMRKFSKPSCSKQSLIEYQQIFQEQQKHIEQLLLPTKDNNNDKRYSLQSAVQKTEEKQSYDSGSLTQSKSNSIFNKIINQYEEQNKQMKKKMSQSELKYQNPDLPNKCVTREFENEQQNELTKKGEINQQIQPGKDYYEQLDNKMAFTIIAEQQQENQHHKKEIALLKTERIGQLEEISKLRNEIQQANLNIQELRETIKLLNSTLSQTKQWEMLNQEMKERIKMLERDNSQLQQLIHKNNQERKQENQRFVELNSVIEKQNLELQLFKKKNELLDSKVEQIEKLNYDLQNTNSKQISQQVERQNITEIQNSQLKAVINSVEENKKEQLPDEDNFFDQLEDYQSHLSNESYAEINKQIK